MGKNKIYLLIHTIRYLKIKQILYRMYYKLRKPRILKIDEAIKLSGWSKWCAPLPENNLWDGENSFVFLGKTDRIIKSQDWNSSKHEKLWLYNLHYLDCINTQNSLQQSDRIISLLYKWIKDNPPLLGAGWEPYCLSLRIVNFIKWLSREDITDQTIITSLVQQAYALYQQVEYHILANHLFVNGKALAFVGAFIKGKGADKWLSKGLKILDEETKEQFLADGGHFELSPMYHSILLWDLCDLVNLAKTSKHPLLIKRCGQWKELILKGLNWLQAMVHPDGEISFFNDASFGIAPTYKDIVNYAKTLNILSNNSYQNLNGQFNYLKESGYVAVKIGSQSKAIIDVGNIGPVYQPGHAHADTLSFELSIGKERVFVNSGTSQYGESLERLRQRSTAAHNTVMVDNHNSSEVWSGFRVARRAKPKNVLLSKKEDGTVRLTAEHNGYKRLPGKVIHKRDWLFSNNRLEINDSLEGVFKNAQARFHIAPGIMVEGVQGGKLRLMTTSGKQLTMAFLGAGEIVIEDTTWHPEFGITVANQCIVVSFNKKNISSIITWQ